MWSELVESIETHSAEAHARISSTEALLMSKIEDLQPGDRIRLRRVRQVLDGKICKLRAHKVSKQGNVAILKWDDATLYPVFWDLTHLRALDNYHTTPHITISL